MLGVVPEVGLSPATADYVYHKHVLALRYERSCVAIVGVDEHPLSTHGADVGVELAFFVARYRAGLLRKIKTG